MEAWGVNNPTVQATTILTWGPNFNAYATENQEEMTVHNDARKSCKLVGRNETSLWTDILTLMWRNGHMSVPQNPASKKRRKSYLNILDCHIKKALPVPNFYKRPAVILATDEKPWPVLWGIPRCRRNVPLLCPLSERSGNLPICFQATRKTWMGV